VDKTTKAESAIRKLTEPKTTRSRLSLTKETLQQFKAGHLNVRSGLKAGVANRGTGNTWIGNTCRG
jgi:hypothetical protein